MDAAPVSIVIDGRLILAAAPARLVEGIVFAPLLPFGGLLAERISVEPETGLLTLERGGRSVTIAIPPVDATPLFPVGVAARGLGDTVRYVPAARTLFIDQPLPAPVATMTPFAEYLAPPGPLPTFTPTPAPTPRPTVTGIPVPRRTPVSSGS